MSWQALDVQHKLLDLFVAPHMSFSLKLQIVRAIDQSTRFTDGMKWFQGNHVLQQTKVKAEANQTGPPDVCMDVEDVKKESCYQRLVNCMMNKQVW